MLEVEYSENRNRRVLTWAILSAAIEGASVLIFTLPNVTVMYRGAARAVGICGADDRPAAYAQIGRASGYARTAAVLPAKSLGRCLFTSRREMAIVCW